MTTAVRGDARPRRIDRVVAVVNRDPLTGPHRTRNDALLAVGVAVLAVALALFVDDGRPLGPLGWALLAGAHVPLVWRRSRPLLVLLAVAACATPHHALDYNHSAPIPATLLALYTVAATGTVRRTLLTAVGVLGLTLIVNSFTNPDGALELLRISGWIIAVLFFGVDAASTASTSPPSSSVPNAPNGPARRRPGAASRRSGCGSHVTCTTCSRTASP